MSLDQRARDAGADLRHQVATIEPSSAGMIAHRSRRGRVATGAAAVAVLALVVGAVALLRVDGDNAAPITTDPPATTVALVGDVPVWYDAEGLHRGDVVEQTPVDLLGGSRDTMGQGLALALVRSGAVYLDPATGDVWFHPWGGESRIVGHNSEAGPGGDPNGETAAWFDGSELVVYDTAANRELSRTDQGGEVFPLAGDHWPAGNGFLQVSAERVVWRGTNFQGEGEVYSHDVRTGSTSVIGGGLLDVHDDVQTWFEYEQGTGVLVLRISGREAQRHPDTEARGRLSASGNYVLTVEAVQDERHAAEIIDTRTGEVWPVPRSTYPWIAWSYGDIALVDLDLDGENEDVLLSCDATRRTCERWHPQRPFLMPTN